MSLIKKPSIRFKYATIRLKNLIDRFPKEVVAKDIILLTLYDIAKDMWKTIYKVPSMKEIKELEETCEFLEELLKNYEATDNNNSEK